MIQLTNIQSQVLLEVFKQLHLSEKMIGQMEDYIDGKVGEDVLDNLSFQDLRRNLHNPSATLLLTFIQKGLLVEAKRYFNILFAIGGPSCSKMLPDDLFRLNRKQKIGIEMDKIVAVYAYENGEKTDLQRHLMAAKGIAEGEAELVRKALSYQNGQSESGKLLLYSLYFFLKYPDVKPAALEGSTTGIGGREKPVVLEGSTTGICGGEKPVVLEGSTSGIYGGEITGLFGGKEDKMKGVLLEEDRELMKEYEDGICGQVNFMLNQGLLKEEIQAISEALHQETLSDETKQMVKRHTVVLKVVHQAVGLAFVNFALSFCLKNFVSLSLCINRTGALNGMEAADLRKDMQIRGGNFDEIFGIDTAKYILWAAQKSCKNILQAQFMKNREIYSYCCDTGDIVLVKRLLEVAKEQDLEFYQEKNKKNQSVEQEKIIKTFVQYSYAAVADTVRKYLDGEVGIEQLYACENQINKRYYYHRIGLDLYCEMFGEDEFYRKCIVLTAMEESYYYFKSKMTSENIEKETKRMLSILDQEKLDLAHQIKIVVILEERTYEESQKKEFMDTVQAVFETYLFERREETLFALQGAGADGRKFALSFLADQAQENKEEILSYAKDSSKMVREKVLEILRKQTDWEADIIQLLGAKKAAARETAIEVLAYWGAQKYQKELEQSLEQEKNAKIRSLLSDVLHREQTGEEMEQIRTREGLVKELHKGGKSRTLAWAYQTPFSLVHKTNKEEASQAYLQAIFLCYAGMQPCGVNKDAAFLAEELDVAEFAVYVNELFDKWMEAGAEAKKRWVLYAASIHGGSKMIQKLQHQIQEWPQYARGAIASDAVQALALNPDPQALLIVDGIARKFKFKQVKAAAGKALDFAAVQLGLEREELEDRIVPDLGFDNHMERVFDYGERQFTVTITTALEIEVYDGSKKKLKNLPAPGKKDDEEKAKKAYEEFKQMKKQMKTAIGSQKARLELALSSERLWNIEAWKSLFVQNPLMHQFAIGLIWGIYQDHRLVQSFRYMEDGTFNTEEEEEFFLPEDGRIGLVHPIELSEESRAAWKQQIEDYEIVQPIVQLERKIFYLTEEEKELRSLERFGGFLVTDLSLSGKLQSFEWERGAILDGGWFDSFYREDAKIGYGVELHFSGSCVGYGDMTEVTIYDVRFYKIDVIDRDHYRYNWLEMEKSLLLSEVPKRYFSEIVLQITAAMASSKGLDEEWRKKMREN